MSINKETLFINQKNKITDIKRKSSILLEAISNNSLSEDTFVHPDIIEKEYILEAKKKLKEAVMFAAKAYSSININKLSNEEGILVNEESQEIIG